MVWIDLRTFDQLLWQRPIYPNSIKCEKLKTLHECNNPIPTYIESYNFTPLSPSKRFAIQFGYMMQTFISQASLSTTSCKTIWSSGRFSPAPHFESSNSLIYIRHCFSIRTQQHQQPIKCEEVDFGIRFEMRYKRAIKDCVSQSPHATWRVFLWRGTYRVSDKRFGSKVIVKLPKV